MIDLSFLRSVRAVTVALSVLASSCQRKADSDSQPVTMAVINARVWTGNPQQPWAEAVAISQDLITLVGSTNEIKAISGPHTRIIDAKGGMVTPGFIDSHVHFIDGGFRLASVQLRNAKTPKEFIERIAAFAKNVPAGTWITGGDWDHTNWGGALPTRTWIDSVTADHPVWIQRLDGHMALANSAAMQLAKVSARTKDVAGGTIVREANRHPTSIFKDNAMSLFDGVVTDPPAVLKDRALEAAMAYVASRGVTSVHNMGSWDDRAVFSRAHKAGTLKTRIYAAVPLATWQLLRDTVAKYGKGDDWLRIGGLKGYADGSLGSHTAALLTPFTDAPRTGDCW